MPAQKSSTRKMFLAELQELKTPGALPPTYSYLAYLKLRKPAVLARIKDAKVLAKLSDPKTAGIYLNQVMKAQRVDFEALAALKSVSEDYLKAQEPVLI